jgi:hypothetical protein
VGAGGGAKVLGEAVRVYSPHLATKSIYPDGETAPAVFNGGGGGAAVEKLGEFK